MSSLSFSSSGKRSSTFCCAAQLIIMFLSITQLISKPAFPDFLLWSTLLMPCCLAVSQETPRHRANTDKMHVNTLTTKFALEADDSSLKRMHTHAQQGCSTLLLYVSMSQYQHLIYYVTYRTHCCHTVNTKDFSMH